MIEVILPDGTRLSFPEGMSKEAMEEAIHGFLAQRQGGGEVPTSNATPSAAPAPQAPAQAPQDRVGSGEAFGRGLEHGVSFGFQDNLVGLTAGLLGAVPDETGGYDYFDYSQGFGDRYAAARDKVRGELTEAREEHPYATLGGELTGGTATSLAVAPVAPVGQSLRTAVPAMAQQGALEGSLSMVGEMNPETPGEMASAVGSGALLGGAIGGAIPVGMAGVKALADPIVGGARAAMDRPYVGRAARAVAAAFRRAGMSPEDAAIAIANAEREGQSMFTTADALGHPGQRALAGLTMQPGAGRTRAQEFLGERQMGQEGRVRGFVEDALGLDHTAAMEGRMLSAERRSVSAPLYEAAEASAEPVNLSGVAMTLDRALRIDPVIGQSSLSQGEMGRRLGALRNRLANGREMLVDFNEVLRVKSDLGAYIAENPGLPPIFGQLHRQLDAALEQASPEYRVANATYRERSLPMDALEWGRDAAMGGVRADDSLERFAALPPAGQGPVMPGLIPDPPEGMRGFREVSDPGMSRPADPQQAFRYGYGDARLGQIERSSPERNAARPFRNPLDVQLMEAMAQDPALWARQMGREQTMFDTNRAGFGGSLTSANQADSLDMNGGGVTAGILANLMMGNIRGSATQALQRAGSAGLGLNERTRDMIVDALMSQDPVTDLQRLMARAETSEQTDRVIAALLRQMGYATAQDRWPQ